MELKEPTRPVIKQLTWTYQPESQREAGDAVVKNLWLHWFPAKVSKASLSWNYSFWLGTISATLFLILTVTGAVLMFLYVPSVERAYQTVKDIEYTVSFGWFLRSLHRIAAHLMVLTVFLHMVRAFFTGAYKNGSATGANRPLNWLVGVVLLLATLFLSFTGYLLPWDQLAYWAITVGTNIAQAAPLVGESIRYILLGGHEIGQNTLIRFYVLHCFFLPVVVLLGFVYHMWRVRKDGGLACVDRESLKLKKEKVEPVPTKTYALLGLTNGRTVHVENSMIVDRQHTVSSSPHLLRRLTKVVVGTLVVSSLLAVLFRPPLEVEADPHVTPNPAKAPWYFLWLQELVTDTTFTIGGYTVNGALVGGILIPGFLLVLLAIWPYLDKSSLHAVGVWFARERRRQNLVFGLIVLAIVVLTIIGTFMRGPFWDFYWPWEKWPEFPVKY